jgi:hypothetical protein
VTDEAESAESVLQDVEGARVGRRDARPTDQVGQQRNRIAECRGVRPGHVRSSSLIEVRERVFSSTRLTMTAQ